MPPNSAPTCRALVDGVVASADTKPGVYAGAVACSGASDTNCDISYPTASLRVDPVISLDQRGLPDVVVPQAFLDGTPVVLPVDRNDVQFGSRHSFRFPGVVIDGAGQRYVTTAAHFDANVTTDIDVTARYLKMRQLLRRAESAGGIRHREAERPGDRWRDIHVLIGQHRNGKAKDALHRFADRVRRRTGDTIRAATAQGLLGYTQAVYDRIGARNRLSATAPSGDLVGGGDVVGPRGAGAAVGRG